MSGFPAIELTWPSAPSNICTGHQCLFFFGVIFIIVLFLSVIIGIPVTLT